MEELQWAYLAGFIDADGMISIGLDKNLYFPIVDITNSDREVMEWFKKFVGAGEICTKQPKKDNHKISYEIRWRYNNALYVCEKCLPFLRVKKNKALLLINEWKQLTPRNGRYTEEMKEKKLDLVNRMRILNRRGVQ